MGNGIPVGCAIASTNIYPALIGTDIGCGMSLVQTNLKTHKINEKKLSRWTKKLNGLEGKKKQTFYCCICILVSFF
jgi:release factor H-coupled RctB family protein